MAEDGLQPSRGAVRRKLYSIPLLLILVPLAIVTLVCVVEALAGFGLRQTGDELFDTYARAVRNRQWLQFYRGSDGHPATLPDAQLARWEDRFGNDPRYWELRFFCAEFRGSNLVVPIRPVSTVEDPAKWRFLERAVELEGSVAAHVRLHNHKSRERSRAIAEVRVPSDIEQLVELMAEDETIQLAELEAAVADNPASAWAYYYLARWHFKMGDWDSALPLLEQGNAAADHYQPNLFPISFLWQELEAGRVPANDRIAGMLLFLDWYEGPNYIQWKEIGKELILGTALGGDIELWQPFHGFVCAMGSHSTATTPAFVAAHLIPMLPEATLVEGAGGLNHHQRSVLLGIMQRSENIARRISRFEAGQTILGSSFDQSAMLFTSSVSMYGTNSAAELMLIDEASWRSRISMALLQEFPGRGYARLPRTALQQLEFCRSDLKPLFEELAQVNYSKLDKPVYSH